MPTWRRLASRKRLQSVEYQIDLIFIFWAGRVGAHGPKNEFGIVALGVKST